MDIKIKTTESKNKVFLFFEEKEKLTFFSQTEQNLKKKILNLPQVIFGDFKNQSVFSISLDNELFLLAKIKQKPTLEDIRQTYSKIYDYLNTLNVKEIQVEVPFTNETEIVSVIEGLDLTNYSFSKYKSEKSKKKSQTVNLDLDKKYSSLLSSTLSVNREVKFVRDLVNENSDIMTPIKLESLAKEFAKKNSLKFKSLNEKQIKKEGLNLLDAVGRGSSNPPRLIFVEYNGNKSSKEKIALVGKGITFDTGGYNLKPTGYIEDMKTDMGGAATVFGAFRAAVSQKLKLNIVLVLSCAENSVSSNAYKPGDTFKGYSGTYVEIENTDAEGRLVLADALAYTQKHFKPTKIVDLATLTGACLVALGPSLIAMLGNSKEEKVKLFESGELTSERVWELPIYDEHRDLIKGKFADIKNSGGRYGGTITAAAFLEKFVNTDKVRWTHLDIAGAARSHKKNHYIPEYGTGIGVRLLYNYLKKN